MKGILQVLFFTLITTVNVYAQDWGSLRGFGVKTEFAYMAPLMNINIKNDSIKLNLKNSTAILSPKLILGYRIGWHLFIGAGVGYETMIYNGGQRHYIPLFLQTDIYFSSFHKILPAVCFRYGYNSLIKNDNSVFNKGKSMFDANLSVQYVINYNIQLNFFTGFGLRRFTTEILMGNDVMESKITYPQLNIGVGLDFGLLKLKK